eukprot:c19544_g1_i1 orf=226-570(+)
MELMTHRHLHCKPPPISATLSSSSHLFKAFNVLLFLPGYGKLKSSHSHSLTFKAVLTDRPSAPTEQIEPQIAHEGAPSYELRPALKQVESLEKQMVLEGVRVPSSRGARSPLKL